MVKSPERFERVEVGAGSWGARLKEARAVRRERGPRREPWEFTISLGSPIQTAACKMVAFSLFSKAFGEFEYCNFKNRVLGRFYELVYTSFFVFQYIERVGISLGLRDCLFCYESDLKI